MNNRKHQGHFARKRFGQNFLQDTFIIDQIIAAIAPQYDQTLVEIGPGLGALTLPMAAHIHRLIVIELDRDLAARLAVHPALTNKLEVYQQDALTVDFTALAAKHQQPLRIFGNLPYNISTLLLFQLFNYANVIQDMHFMLQKEVVNRLVAGPDNKEYGRLSVMTHYFCQVIPVLEVPPSAFRPAPKVDSAVVRLIPHQQPLYPVTDLNCLQRITAQAFNQRRKTIRNSLRGLIPDSIKTELGLPLTLRAENLTLEHYCWLANRLAAQTARHEVKSSELSP